LDIISGVPRLVSVIGNVRKREFGQWSLWLLCARKDPFEYRRNCPKFLIKRLRVTIGVSMGPGLWKQSSIARKQVDLSYNGLWRSVKTFLFG